MQKVLGDMDESRQKDGSRNADGNVPNANWNDGKFQINWFNTDNRNDNLRPREEISHNRGLLWPFFVLSLLATCYVIYPIGCLSGYIKKFYR